MFSVRNVLFFIIPLVIGWTVGVAFFNNGSNRIYQFYGKPDNGQSAPLGFACICSLSPNGTKGWTGSGNDPNRCGGGNSDQATSLSANIIPERKKIYGVAIPAGACCKSTPKVGGTVIPISPPC